MGDVVRQLLDFEELRALKARYFRTLDTQQWDAWGEVFAPDAVLEMPEVQAMHEGREAIVAAVRAALDGARTVHHGHMPELELTGSDTARGIWAMYDYVEWPPGDGGARRGLQGYGHYHEEYRREDGVWRIARCRLERLRIDGLRSVPT